LRTIGTMFGEQLWSIKETRQGDIHEEWSRSFKLYFWSQEFEYSSEMCMLVENKKQLPISGGEHYW